MLAIPIIITASILLSVSGEKLLLATDRGVLQLTSDNGTISTLHPYPATNLHFRHHGNDLYFISNNDIYYSYYSEYFGRQSEPLRLISGVTERGLAVDWLHYRLFFNSLAAKAVLEAPLLQPPSGHVFTPKGHLQAIAIDPYARMVFCIEDGQLVSVALDGGQRREYQLLESVGVERVEAMAVDLHAGRVLVAGQGVLVATDYSNTQALLLHRDSRLSPVLTLAVVADLVVWATKDVQGKFSLYSCALAPNFHSNSITLLWESLEAIHDVKFHTTLEQTASSKAACALLHCAHGCAEVSAYTVSCTCPEGLLLNKLTNTCTDTPPADEDGSTDTIDARLKSLGNAMLQQLDRHKTHLGAAIFVCCALMVALLSCGFCLLQCHIHEQDETSISFLEEGDYPLDNMENSSPQDQS